MTHTLVFTQALYFHQNSMWIFSARKRLSVQGQGYGYKPAVHAQHRENLNKDDIIKTEEHFVSVDLVVTKTELERRFESVVLLATLPNANIKLVWMPELDKNKN